MKAHLTITTWADALPGASHYYGRLKVGVKHFDISRALTQPEAAALNLDEHEAGGDFRPWKVGDESGCFFSEAAVEQAAIKIVRDKYPEVTLLFKGDPCILDPQPVLIGPEPLKTELNGLVAEAKANDWWEGDVKHMTNIYERWRKVVPA